MHTTTGPVTEPPAIARAAERRTFMPHRAYHRAGTRLAKRMPGVDLFRGIVMACMIVVSSLRTFPGVRPVLHHAPWRGLTVVDLGLPFFMFTVGVAAFLSLDSRRRRGQSDARIVRHAAGRVLFFVAVGIIGTTFPYFAPATITLTGVLQFIAFGYLVTTLLLLRTSERTQLAIIGAVLIGYWALLTFVPVPGTGMPGHVAIDYPTGTVVAWVDRHVIGAHMDPAAFPWDPQGVLPTLVAATTVMLGALAGRWLRSERRADQQMVGLFAVGMLAGMAGLVWGWTFPIIKEVWTSSFVLVTGGGGAMALAFCIWLTRLPGSRRFTTPVIALGVNAFFAYAGFYVIDEVMAAVHVTWGGGAPVVLRQALFTHLFASWLPMSLALAAWGTLTLVVWLGVAHALYRKGIVLTV